MQVYNPVSFAEIAARPERWFIFTGTKTVPAGGSIVLQLPIGNDAHFASWFFTCTYPTIQAGVDDGVSRLAVQVRDDASQRALSNDFVDLATIAVPGRRRTVGIAGDPSQAINIPGMPFPRLWEANSNIEMDFRNTSDTDAEVKIAWHGYKYPTWIYGARLPEPKNPALQSV